MKNWREKKIGANGSASLLLLSHGVCGEKISNKQLLSTETQIRKLFHKLRRFLKEDLHLWLRKRSGGGRLSAEKGRWFRSRSLLCHTVSLLLNKTCRSLTCHCPDQSPGLAVRSTGAGLKSADRCGQTPGQPVLQSLGEDPLHSCHSGLKRCKSLAPSVRLSDRCETWTQKAAVRYTTPE